MEKKGHSQDELHQIITWLTGYSETTLQDVLDDQRSFKVFFETAPAPNPDRRLITGSICGVRVEDITDPLMQEIRYLDKLVHRRAPLPRHLVTGSLSSILASSLLPETLTGVP